MSLALEADLATIPGATGLVPTTVVALPASSADADAAKMRVYIGGVLTSRAYDPVLVQP